MSAHLHQSPPPVYSKPLISFYYSGCGLVITRCSDMGQPSEALMGKICKTRLSGFFGSSPASSLGLRLQNSMTQADPCGTWWCLRTCSVSLSDSQGHKSEDKRTLSAPPFHTLHCLRAGSFDPHQRRHVLGHTGSPR